MLFRALELLKLLGLVEQVNRTAEELRTCDWRQRFKPLPTTRTEQAPHKALMGMPRCITCDFALVTGRNVTSHWRQSPSGKALVRGARLLRLVGSLGVVGLAQVANPVPGYYVHSSY